MGHLNAALQVLVKERSRLQEILDSWKSLLSRDKGGINILERARPAQGQRRHRRCLRVAHRKTHETQRSTLSPARNQRCLSRPLTSQQRSTRAFLGNLRSAQC